MPEINPSFAALISDARKARGLTQAEIAQRLGYTNTYISKFERGIVPSRKKLLSVLDALEVNDPEERMTILLAAGHLRSEDLALGQNTDAIEALPETQVLDAQLQKLAEQSRPDARMKAQVLKLLEDELGQEVIEQAPKLVELLTEADLTKDQAKEVLDNLLDNAKFLLHAIAKIRPT